MEGGPLRHEKRPGPKAEKHHRDRNAFLPGHAQATFLFGMAQTSTGVRRPIMVAMVFRSGLLEEIAKDRAGKETPKATDLASLQSAKVLQCVPDRRLLPHADQNWLAMAAGGSSAKLFTMDSATALCPADDRCRRDDASSTRWGSILSLTGTASSGLPS